MSSSEAAHIPIFASLKGRDRDKVLGNATQRTYAPGATLVAEGERSVNLFFIASGHARVSTAHEGQRAILGPGDFFGELGLIEMHPRTATVVAEDEITCVLLPAWEFRDVLAEHPQMAVAMFYALVARLHGMAPHEHPAEHTTG
jgi:CRP/FNR family transcriptional regulator, cyclic AMP receptor protein